MRRGTRRLPAIVGLLVVLTSLPFAAPVVADNTAQALPYAQAWTNIAQITTNDDWSGVPGVIGYLGQGLTAATDIDPRTVTGESVVAGDITVLANQTSTAATAGDVAEFHITDPVVALQGSGTADAPYIKIHLDTTGDAGINVAYNVRDIDGTVDNAAQQVDLQYRVGSTGAFASVTSGTNCYIADATTGPNIATLVSAVNCTLPAAADDQPLVEVRVITTNAAGNDEWVGIDDISISTGPVPDTAPSVSSTTPADNDTGVAVDANISITFSEAVNVTSSWFTIICADSGTHTAAESGSSPTFTLNPDVDFFESELCTVTIEADFVTDQDSDDPPDNMTADHVFSFTTAGTGSCGDAFTAIYTIQGSGASTPIPGNVTTEGIVIADFEHTDATSRGFYIQDPTGDANNATSDGIFVFTGANTAPNVGDSVRVTGFARERFSITTLNGSNSDSSGVTDIEVCSTGNTLPGPTDLTLPFASATQAEQWEGMYVTFTQTLVIAEYFNYDRFGEIVLAKPIGAETRPFTPTSIEEPGSAAYTVRSATNLLSRITLDDTLGPQNPAILRHPNGSPFSLTNYFRGGDTVTNTIGVLTYEFTSYRIQPTAGATYNAVNPRPSAPADTAGRLTVAAQNTLNFFITADYPTGNINDNKCGPANNVECRGWDSDQATEFTRQRDKLLATLVGLDADVIGLNEIENSTGVDPLGDPTNGIVAGLNAILGAGTYAAIDTGTIGTDAIKVGLIYRTASVQPIGDHAILDSTVDPRFIDTKSRPVLAQTFREVSTGAFFTVAVNHLKSKGSACDDVGDPDAGDGQGNCNGTRTLAAQALVDWLATDPTSSGDSDFLIIGDLNAYAMEDPVDAIKDGPDDTPSTSDDYTNLVQQFIGTYAYSYVFDGQSGYLDHALSSATLTSQVTGVAEWHINADESDVLDYDTSFKPPAQDALYEAEAYRSSDHDGVIVGLDLTPDCTTAPFSDVPTDHAFCSYISWLKVNGISNGFEDGTYRPENNVTRQAMAAFLTRIADADPEPCISEPFIDVPVSHPFCPEITWMATEGITTGYADGTFRPVANVTRQAMAAFLARLAEADPEPCTSAPFDDVPVDHPFCAEINWLATNGITTGFEDGNFRPIENVTRQAMAAFLVRTWPFLP